MRNLDPITIGRSSVDLNGDQVGGRPEVMGSFPKHIGGSPASTARGTARLAPMRAVITGVVPRGHRPRRAPYGFEPCFPNVMAGPRRAWRFTPAPEVEFAMPTMG